MLYEGELAKLEKKVTFIRRLAAYLTPPTSEYDEPVEDWDIPPIEYGTTSVLEMERELILKDGQIEKQQRRILAQGKLISQLTKALTETQLLLDDSREAYDGLLEMYKSKSY